MLIVRPISSPSPWDRRGRDAVESGKDSTFTEDADIVEWRLDSSEHDGVAPR
jgi:hypothetical protein